MKRPHPIVVLCLAVGLTLAACDQSRVRDGNGQAGLPAMPSTPPSEFGETPPPTGHRLLFEGLVIDAAKDAFALQTPGVFFSLPAFPIETGTRLDRYNPLGLPDDVRRRIAGLNPEIRTWGTDRGIAVEYRGWQQAYSVQSKDGNCAVMFDYRVSVIERPLASDTTFGRIDRPFEFVQVLVPPPPGRSGLYVLVIVTVEVNSKLFGKRFQESNAGIAKRRASQIPPQTTVVDAMPRWFIVEHELMHADQIRRAYKEVVDGVAKKNTLCVPTRPVNMHKALVEKGFNTAWNDMTSGGQGGDHGNPDYPNTPAEDEARDAAWRLFDARGGR